MPIDSEGARQIREEEVRLAAARELANARNKVDGSSYWLSETGLRDAAADINAARKALGEHDTPDNLEAATGLSAARYVDAANKGVVDSDGIIRQAGANINPRFHIGTEAGLVNAAQSIAGAQKELGALTAGERARQAAQRALMKEMTRRAGKQHDVLLDSAVDTQKNITKFILNNPKSITQAQRNAISEYYSDTEQTLGLPSGALETISGLSVLEAAQQSQTERLRQARETAKTLPGYRPGMEGLIATTDDDGNPDYSAFFDQAAFNQKQQKEAQEMVTRILQSTEPKRSEFRTQGISGGETDEAAYAQAVEEHRKYSQRLGQAVLSGDLSSVLGGEDQRPSFQEAFPTETPTTTTNSGNVRLKSREPVDISRMEQEVLKDPTKAGYYKGLDGSYRYIGP